MSYNHQVLVNLAILRTWCDVNPKYGMGIDADQCPKVVSWLDDAIDILNTREPLSVEVIGEFTGMKAGNCPKCGKRINSGDFPKYCGKCGQAVKWDG